MKNSKLVETLKLFSKDELTSLGKYLDSSYFQREKNHHEIYLLFKILQRYSCDWDSVSLSKEEVYLEVYGSEKMISGKLDKLMSGLLAEIHRFIAQFYKSRDQEKIETNISLSIFYRERKMEKFSNFYLEKAKKEISKFPIHDEKYFYNHFQLTLEELPRNLIRDKLTNSYDFLSAQQSLDANYLLVKLDLICTLLSFYRFRKRIDISKLTEFLDGVKPLFTEQGTLEIPIIRIYYRAYELLRIEGEEKSIYKELKAMINEYKEIIPFANLKTLNGILRNFIISRINRGDHHLLAELFALQKEHLKNNSLGDEDGIIPSIFKNIVANGLKLKEFDWVHSFLKEYKNRIKGISSPEDVYYFNLANYHFAKGEYDDALSLLSDRYEDIYYKISAKRLEVKILYEMDSLVLDSRIDAFKIFIYRLPKNAILKSKREGSNHFIDILRQIRNPKSATHNSRYKKLREKIKSEKSLDDRDWLLQKLEEQQII